MCIRDRGTDDWYRTKNITLTAPEGYNIIENLYDRSGRMPTLDIELEEGENHIVYYLIKEDNTTVSEQRTKILYLDTKAPQINGLEEGKVYCEAVTFSVVEMCIRDRFKGAPRKVIGAPFFY